ncbi:cell surface antigen I/II [Striga asiatica]|uniref:Cell surface antigen I/II n=1 Tax=Striga asiatica TaxID=4170 RepID=A0A5A7QSB2_STRAF|nr:cell surface antigen I/II [Striga asiatica]
MNLHWAITFMFFLSAIIDLSHGESRPLSVLSTLCGHGGRIPKIPPPPKALYKGVKPNEPYQEGSPEVTLPPKYFFNSGKRLVPTGPNREESPEIPSPPKYFFNSGKRLVPTGPNREESPEIPSPPKYFFNSGKRLVLTGPNREESPEVPSPPKYFKKDKF